jgi:hypothetical protein
MAKGFVRAIAIAMVMPAILPARSDEIPTLDVRPVCRGIANQSADPLEAGIQATFEQCTQGEQQVREQLKKAWSTFSTADKQHCVALANTGGESSYTELLTCLEMARDVRALRSAEATSETADAAGNQSIKSGRAKTRAQSSPSPSPPVQPPSSESVPRLTDRTSSSPSPAPASPSPASPSTSTMQPAPAANEPSKTMVKELQQAKVDAINARASESMAQRKLTDAEADLKRAKEEAGRATKEAEQAKEDAQAARESRAEAENKLAAAEAARVAAEDQEKACQSAAKSQPGNGGWLRGLFGHKPSSPQNP